MRALYRLALLTVLVGGSLAGVASASPYAPAQGAASFTVAVTAPQTVQRGAQVTVSVTITNLTEANLVAHASWTLTGPFKPTPMFAGKGQFSVAVPAFDSVTKQIKFTVPKSMPVGTYTLTLSVADASAPALATIAVT